MANDELLVPKYLVKIKYPGSIFKVGQIVDLGKDSYVTGMDECPEVFEKLNWWHGIPEKDMPFFLKFIWDEKIDDVVKVKRWLYQKEWDSSTPIIGFTHESKSDSTIFPRVSLNGWLPATKEDYDANCKMASP